MKSSDTCAEYQDQHIHYHRNSRNLGWVANTRQAIQLAHGQYFILAEHDDRYAPTLLACGVQFLEEHPDTVLCSSNVHVIDNTSQIPYIQQLTHLLPKTSWAQTRYDYQFAFPRNHSQLDWRSRNPHRRFGIFR